MNHLPLYLGRAINVLFHSRQLAIKDELLQDRQLWAVFQAVLKLLRAV